MRSLGITMIAALLLAAVAGRDASAAGITKSFDALADAQKYCSAQYKANPAVVRKDNYDSSSGSSLYLPGRTIYVSSSASDFRNSGFAGVYVCQNEATPSGWLDRAQLKTFDACPDNAKMSYFATKLPGSGGDAIVQYPFYSEGQFSKLSVVRLAPQGRYCAYGGTPLWTGWKVMSGEQLVSLLTPTPPPPPIVRTSSDPHPIALASSPPEPADCNVNGTGSWPHAATITLHSGKVCTIQPGSTVSMSVSGSNLVATSSVGPRQQYKQVTIPLAVITSLSTGKHSYNSAQLTMFPIWQNLNNDLRTP